VREKCGKRKARAIWRHEYLWHGSTRNVEWVWYDMKQKLLCFPGIRLNYEWVKARQV